MVLKGIGIVEDKAGGAELLRKTYAPVDVADERLAADQARLRRCPAGAYVELPSLDEFTDSSLRPSGRIPFVQGVPLPENLEVIHDGHELAVEMELECRVPVQRIEKMVDKMNELHLEAFLNLVPLEIPMGMRKNVDVENPFHPFPWMDRTPLLYFVHDPRIPFLVMRSRQPPFIDPTGRSLKRAQNITWRATVP